MPATYLFVELTPELRLLLAQAASRRRARNGGCRFPGRQVICGCGTVYPLEDASCPTCALAVEHAVPLYKTMTLPARVAVS